MGPRRGVTSRGQGCVGPLRSRLDSLATIGFDDPESLHATIQIRAIGLQASRCFGDARSGGARKRSSDGKFEFTVDSDLTCDTGEKPAGRS